MIHRMCTLAASSVNVFVSSKLKERDNSISTFSIDTNSTTAAPRFR